MPLSAFYWMSSHLDATVLLGGAVVDEIFIVVTIASFDITIDVCLTTWISLFGRFLAYILLPDYGMLTSSDVFLTSFSDLSY